jgi:receptor protein-tyrosine kinase
LPAGHRHGKATELLASAAMRNFAEELATRYADRIIIFDSPPLLMTTEARVLATLVGQIVVVVEESRTSQPVLKEALSMLESCEVVGLVLNKSKRPGGADYYGGYGYGYGYGYGSK